MGSSDTRLTDRRVLVTGGGRGIGCAIALLFAREGAHVAVAARTGAETESVAEKITSLGRNSAALIVDVTSPEAVTRMARAAEKQLGPIEILVNAAGGAESAPLHRTDWSLWRKMLAVNLDGVFLCTSALLPGMMERARGRVINIASRAGLSGYPYVSAYCAAKHGVIGFTRATALELEGKGVTINALCPGYVDTEMTRHSAERIAAKTGISTEDALARLAAFNEDGKLISPETVADAALELAADEGATMNGQALPL
jgi:NAD(P)-dependent dehydrogenase (short-subunit alcohol dehydrogenase family)